MKWLSTERLIFVLEAHVDRQALGAAAGARRSGPHIRAEGGRVMDTAPDPLVNAMHRRAAEGHACVVPDCQNAATVALVCREAGPLAGEDHQAGEFIDLCAPHHIDVLLAAGRPIDRLAEWLRADAVELARRRRPVAQQPLLTAARCRDPHATFSLVDDPPEDDPECE